MLNAHRSLSPVGSIAILGGALRMHPAAIMTTTTTGTRLRGLS